MSSLSAGGLVDKADSYLFYERQALIKTDGSMIEKTSEVVKTDVFRQVLLRYIAGLRNRSSHLLDVFDKQDREERQDQEMLELLQHLAEKPRKEIISKYPYLKKYFSNVLLLHQFVEELYNFWRSHERYLICYSGHDMGHDKKPYRTFAATIELLNDLVRGCYRDICENITGNHPQIFRQMPSGCQIGVIAKNVKMGSLDGVYDKLKGVQVIRQVLIHPPLILDSPTNKRTGRFEPIDFNLLEQLELDKDDYLCYPAKVGGVVVYVYFHVHFIGLGTSMANLFDLASDEDLKKKPDAIFIFGADPEKMKGLKNKTVFYDDKKNELLVGFVPLENEFGYFGYVKKMVLTLHNIMMMKKGRMPVHGAMVCIRLKNGSAANVVIIGDSGAGKSESIEAFRVLGHEYIKDMTLVFDDMGSLEIDGNKVRAYGTETGAFVRLDDLQPGFAYGNMDRSIIISPHKINARAILPITTMEEVLYGHQVDMVLYANNYEQVDDAHPHIEWFDDPKKAFDFFKHGLRMAKGTTSEVGLTQSYFANPFGPPQFMEKHEKIAWKMFEQFFKSDVKVGQLRTELGIPGYESKGPQSAAKALFHVIEKR